MKTKQRLRKMIPNPPFLPYPENPNPFGDYEDDFDEEDRN